MFYLHTDLLELRWYVPTTVTGYEYRSSNDSVGIVFSTLTSNERTCDLLIIKSSQQQHAMALANWVRQSSPNAYVAILRVADEYIVVFTACIAVAFLCTAAFYSVFYYSHRLSAKYRAAVADMESRGDGARDRALLGLRPLSTPGATRWLHDEPSEVAGSGILEFTSALGLRIAVYQWKAKTTQPAIGCVMLFHGSGCWAESEFAKRPGLRVHLGYQNSWIEALNDAGFDVIAHDCNGHGRSESVADGARSMCYAFNDYVDEAVQLRRLLGERAAYDGVPIFALGQSMGAAIALLTAERCASSLDNAFAGICLCSPALRFEDLKKKPSNMVLLPLLDILSTVAPWLRVGSGEPHPMKEVKEEMDALSEEMFDMGNLRARFCAEALRAGERGLADAQLLAGVPLLLLHDPADKFTDPSGSAMLHAALPSSSRLIAAVGHDIVSHDTSGALKATVVAHFEKHSKAHL